MRRLAMDFQPVFMSGYSLKRHDPSHWEHKVQPSVVSAQDAACAICGFVAKERRRIEADEVWVFPGVPHVTLTNVRPLCSRCHDAKDFSHLRNLIQNGVKRLQREIEIIQHYCEINKCNIDEFRTDYDKAFANKRAIEEDYGMNCRPVIDYGLWGRNPEKPRLTKTELELLRKVFDSTDEPIEISDYIFTSYRSAVRQIQSIYIGQRAPIFAAIEAVLDEDDAEFEMFPDHECPEDINMAND